MTLKRLLDVVVALLLSIAVLPVILVLGALILGIDRHNPFFAQRRLGRNELPFTMYKLRTMKSDTLDVPTHEVSASSVSKLGGFLRRTKLDELPQLWSVIRGDMSFVGPRPGLVDHDELTVNRRALNVFSLVPGITGVSQIDRIDMSDPKRLAESDARYIGRDSLSGDIGIMWATLMGKGSGDRINR
jgi:lipopolysaccharide/colanic/teichoic acid biosynthesis glycosyltransferase